MEPYCKLLTIIRFCSCKKQKWDESIIKYSIYEHKHSRNCGMRLVPGLCGRRFDVSHDDTLRTEHKTQRHFSQTHFCSNSPPFQAPMRRPQVEENGFIEFISPKTAISVLIALGNEVLVTLTGQRSPGFSSGTCACGTAPPGAPGTAESWPAGGRGAPGGQWHWPAPADPASACGPRSPSAPGTPADRRDKITHEWPANALLQPKHGH